MLEGLISSLLNRYLSRFLYVDTEQLQIGVWSGQLHLTNLQIKPGIFDSLPIGLQRGNVGSFDISLNWVKISSVPIQITLKDVFLYAELRQDTSILNPDIPLTAELIQQWLREQKQKILESAIDQLPRSKEFAKENSSSFAASFFASIIDNIQINIQNVHVCINGVYAKVDEEDEPVTVISELNDENKDRATEDSKNSDLPTTEKDVEFEEKVFVNTLPSSRKSSTSSRGSVRSIAVLGVPYTFGVVLLSLSVQTTDSSGNPIFVKSTGVVHKRLEAKQLAIYCQHQNVFLASHIESGMSAPHSSSTTITFDYHDDRHFFYLMQRALTRLPDSNMKDEEVDFHTSIFDDLEYLLHPVNATVQLKISKQAANVISAPVNEDNSLQPNERQNKEHPSFEESESGTSAVQSKIVAAIEIGNINLSLAPHQFQACKSILEHFSPDPSKRPELDILHPPHLRPIPHGLSRTVSGKQWWQYAIAVIRSQVQKKQLEWSWDYIADARHDYYLYLPLYRAILKAREESNERYSKLLEATLAIDDQNLIKEIEDVWPIQTILTWRILIAAQCQMEDALRQMHKRQVNSQRSTTVIGWLGTFFYSSPSPSSLSIPEAPALELKNWNDQSDKSDGNKLIELDNDEREKLTTILGYDPFAPIAEVQGLRHEPPAFIIELSLPSVTLTLRQADQVKLVICSLQDLRVTVRHYQRKSKVDIILHTFHVEDCMQRESPVFRYIVSSSTSSADLSLPNKQNALIHISYTRTYNENTPNHDPFTSSASLQDADFVVSEVLEFDFNTLLINWNRTSISLLLEFFDPSSLENGELQQIRLLETSLADSSKGLGFSTGDSSSVHISPESLLEHLRAKLLFIEQLRSTRSGNKLRRRVRYKQRKYSQQSSISLSQIENGMHSPVIGSIDFGSQVSPQKDSNILRIGNNMFNRLRVIAHMKMICFRLNDEIVDVSLTRLELSDLYLTVDSHQPVINTEVDGFQLSFSTRTPSSFLHLKGTLGNATIYDTSELSSLPLYRSRSSTHSSLNKPTVPSANSHLYSDLSSSFKVSSPESNGSRVFWKRNDNDRSLISFTFLMNDNIEEQITNSSSLFTNTCRGYDSSLDIRMSSVQCVLAHKFISIIHQYMDEGLLRQAKDKAAQTAARAIHTWKAELLARSFLFKFSITINNPLILLPHSDFHPELLSRSHSNISINSNSADPLSKFPFDNHSSPTPEEYLVIDLGTISLRNSAILSESEYQLMGAQNLRTLVPLESIQVSITALNILRVILVNPSSKRAPLKPDYFRSGSFPHLGRSGVENELLDNSISNPLRSAKGDDDYFWQNAVRYPILGDMDILCQIVTPLGALQYIEMPQNAVRVEVSSVHIHLDDSLVQFLLSAYEHEIAPLISLYDSVTTSSELHEENLRSSMSMTTQWGVEEHQEITSISPVGDESFISQLSINSPIEEKLNDEIAISTPPSKKLTLMLLLHEISVDLRMTLPSLDDASQDVLMRSVHNNGTSSPFARLSANTLDISLTILEELQSTIPMELKCSIARLSLQDTAQNCPHTLFRQIIGGHKTQESGVESLSRRRSSRKFFPVSDSHLNELLADSTDFASLHKQKQILQSCKRKKRDTAFSSQLLLSKTSALTSTDVKSKNRWSSKYLPYLSLAPTVLPDLTVLLNVDTNGDSQLSIDFVSPRVVISTSLISGVIHALDVFGSIFNSVDRISSPITNNADENSLLVSYPKGFTVNVDIRDPQIWFMSDPDIANTRRQSIHVNSLSLLDNAGQSNPILSPGAKGSMLPISRFSANDVDSVDSMSEGLDDDEDDDILQNAELSQATKSVSCLVFRCQLNCKMEIKPVDTATRLYNLEFSAKQIETLVCYRAHHLRLSQLSPPPVPVWEPIDLSIILSATESRFTSHIAAQVNFSAVQSCFSFLQFSTATVILQSLVDASKSRSDDNSSQIELPVDNSTGNLPIPVTGPQSPSTIQLILAKFVMTASIKIDRADVAIVNDAPGYFVPLLKFSLMTFKFDLTNHPEFSHQITHLLANISEPTQTQTFANGNIGEKSNNGALRFNVTLTVDGAYYNPRMQDWEQLFNSWTLEARGGMDKIIVSSLNIFSTTLTPTSIQVLFEGVESFQRHFLNNIGVREISSSPAQSPNRNVDEFDTIDDRSHKGASPTKSSGLLAHGETILTISPGPVRMKSVFVKGHSDNSQSRVSSTQGSFFLVRNETGRRCRYWSNVPEGSKDPGMISNEITLEPGEERIVELRQYIGVGLSRIPNDRRWLYYSPTIGITVEPLEGSRLWNSIPQIPLSYSNYLLSTSTQTLNANVEGIPGLMIFPLQHCDSKSNNLPSIRESFPLTPQKLNAVNATSSISPAFPASLACRIVAEKDSEGSDAMILVVSSPYLIVNRTHVELEFQLTHIASDNVLFHCQLKPGQTSHLPILEISPHSISLKVRPIWHATQKSAHWQWSQLLTLQSISDRVLSCVLMRCPSSPAEDGCVPSFHCRMNLYHLQTDRAQSASDIFHTIAFDAPISFKNLLGYTVEYCAKVFENPFVDGRDAIVTDFQAHIGPLHNGVLHHLQEIHWYDINVADDSNSIVVLQLRPVPSPPAIHLDVSTDRDGTLPWTTKLFAGSKEPLQLFTRAEVDSHSSLLQEWDGQWSSPAIIHNSTALHTVSAFSTFADNDDRALYLRFDYSQLYPSGMTPTNVYPFAGESSGVVSAYLPYWIFNCTGLPLLFSKINDLGSDVAAGQNQVKTQSEYKLFRDHQNLLLRESTRRAPWYLFTNPQADSSLFVGLEALIDPTLQSSIGSPFVGSPLGSSAIQKWHPYFRTQPYSVPPFLLSYEPSTLVYDVELTKSKSDAYTEQLGRGHRIALRLSNSEWSAPFTIDALGTHGEVEITEDELETSKVMTKPKKRYGLGVSVGLHPDKLLARTKIIIIHPRVLLNNETDFELQYQIIGTGEHMTLAAGKQCPVHGFAHHKLRLSFRFNSYGWKWCAPRYGIPVDEVGMRSVRVRQESSRDFAILNVNIRLVHATFEVDISMTRDSQFLKPVDRNPSQTALISSSSSAHHSFRKTFHNSRYSPIPSPIRSPLSETISPTFSNLSNQVNAFLTPRTVSPTYSMMQSDWSRSELPPDDEAVATDTADTVFSTDDIPYRIENFSLHTMLVYQAGAEHLSEHLAPYRSTPYAWDEPSGKQEVVISLLDTSSVQDENGLLHPNPHSSHVFEIGKFNLDRIAQYPISNLKGSNRQQKEFVFSNLSVSVYADGRVRVLCLSELSESERRKQTLSVPSPISFDISFRLAGISISIVTHSFRNVENERQFADNLRGYLDPPITRKELLHLYISDINLQVNESSSGTSISAAIEHLQLDNQLHNSVYPVILCPSESNRKNVSNSGSKSSTSKSSPLLELSIFKSYEKSRQVKPLSTIKHPSTAFPSTAVLFPESIYNPTSYSSSTMNESFKSNRHYQGTRIILDSSISNSVNGFPTGLRISTDFVDADKPRPNSLASQAQPRKPINTSQSMKAVSKKRLQVARPLLLYFERFSIHPVQVNVSYSASLNTFTFTRENSNYYLFQVVLRALNATLLNIDGAPLRLSSLHLQDVFASSTELTDRITRHYIFQVSTAFYKLIGSSDVLGNPVGLFTSISTGIQSFFYEPVAGLVHSPQAFTQGIAKGTLSLVRHSVYGVSNTTRGVLSSLAKGLAALSESEEHTMAPRRRSATSFPTTNSFERSINIFSPFTFAIKSVLTITSSAINMMSSLAAIVSKAANPAATKSRVRDPNVYELGIFFVIHSEAILRFLSNFFRDHPHESYYCHFLQKQSSIASRPTASRSLASSVLNMRQLFRTGFKPPPLKMLILTTTKLLVLSYSFGEPPILLQEIPYADIINIESSEAKDGSCLVTYEIVPTSTSRAIQKLYLPVAIPQTIISKLIG